MVKQQKNYKENGRLKNTSIAGVQHTTIQQYGAAAKQHYVSYSGIDNEIESQISKGLKQISESKLNPDYREINIKQQAGFAAETKTVARENAKNIINDQQSYKTVRTDDMIKQSDGKGNTVGGTNEQLYDIARIDSNGIYVKGTARQLKFVGEDANECLTKLLCNKYDKYREADVPIEVPSDFYDDIQKELSERAEKYKKYIKNNIQKGNFETAEKHTKKLERVEKTQSNLRKGNLTCKEAIEAREHPLISTAKDIAKISHQAGIQAAEMGAIIGGGISTIQNIVSIFKCELSVDEAISNISKDTAKSTSLSYASALVGASLKGAMQNSNKTYIQTLSKSNLPAYIVTTVLEVGKTISKFAQYEIDGMECLTELGEKGAGITASSIGAIIGETVIPIKIVGGLIGSMIGYSLSTAFYNDLVHSLRNAKIAREERMRIEYECNEAILAMRKYRIQIETLVKDYMCEHISAFDSAFSEMEKGIDADNINEFISGANIITEQLGGVPFFKTQHELDAMMNSTEKIKI